MRINFLDITEVHGTTIQNWTYEMEDQPKIDKQEYGISE